MDLNGYRDRLKQLKKLAEYHSRLYYEEDSPSISDNEYDRIIREIEEIETVYPQLIQSDSPTVRVGGRPLSKFEQTRHSVKLLSLENAFSQDEIRLFERRVRQEVENGYNIEYIVEYKIDGLSVALTYESGILMKGATRGDGEVGELITENLKTMREIPQRLSEPVDITVRGEVYISKYDFAAINEDQELKGLQLYANPRNLAAGSLRQLDKNVAASRPLSIFIFDVLSGDVPSDSQHENFEYLKKLGFKVSKAEKYDDIEKVISDVVAMAQGRHDLEFDIDGMVIKLDSLQLRNRIGVRSKSPKWAVAYKFPPEETVTILRDISVHVGRTGVITPRAEFDPVRVAGSVIARASLHNQDYIDSKDIRIGDKIVVTKAGDIIPQVVKVVKEERNREVCELQPFKLPEYCPECNMPTVSIEGEAALRCVNSRCPAILKRSIIHYVSKGAMDIDGVGEQLVNQLIIMNYITDFTDLYRLKEVSHELEKIEGMGERSVGNMLEAVERSKGNDLSKLIFSLGIPLVGERAAKTFAKTYKSLNKFMEADEISLTSIDGVGKSMAQSVTTYFSNEKNVEKIRRLTECGVNTKYIREDENPDEAKIFSGMSVVITGTMNDFSRSEAKDIIENSGGKVSSSVSKKTGMLIYGDAPGSKLERAKELGIRLVDEQEFKKMIGSEYFENWKA